MGNKKKGNAAPSKTANRNVYIAVQVLEGQTVTYVNDDGEEETETSRRVLMPLATFEREQKAGVDNRADALRFLKRECGTGTYAVLRVQSVVTQESETVKQVKQKQAAL